MKISKTEEGIVYKCSICGHEHIKLNNGDFRGRLFKKHSRKISVPEPVEKKTIRGLETITINTEHEGYICPICNKLQIIVED